MTYLCSPGGTDNEVPAFPVVLGDNVITEFGDASVARCSVVIITVVHENSSSYSSAVSSMIRSAYVCHTCSSQRLRSSMSTVKLLGVPRSCVLPNTSSGAYNWKITCHKVYILSPRISQKEVGESRQTKFVMIPPGMMYHGNRAIVDEFHSDI